MSYTQTVGSSTLDLIKSLQSKAYLNQFFLAGGTALALYLDHRKSNDIDLFSNFDFNSGVILEQIQHDFSFRLYLSASNTLKGFIGEINVDLLAHRYELIAGPETIHEVSVLSLPDIIAMKLNAISTSGQRSKDFIDIFYLLQHYDIAKMLEFYKKKYKQENVGHILKSLIYFDDVDLADWPVLIANPKLRWIDVRKRIEKVVMDYSRKA